MKKPKPDKRCRTCGGNKRVPSRVERVGPFSTRVVAYVECPDCKPDEPVNPGVVALLDAIELNAHAIEEAAQAAFAVKAQHSWTHVGLRLAPWHEQHEHNRECFRLIVQAVAKVLLEQTDREAVHAIRTGDMAELDAVRRRRQELRTAGEVAEERR